MAETKSVEPPEPGEQFPGSKTRHGTHSGWSKHKQRGEKPCDSCTRAKEVYDARWLSASDNTKRNRLYAKAQIRAYQSLARKYPEEYQKAYEAERDRLLEEHGFAPRPVRQKKGD